MRTSGQGWPAVGQRPRGAEHVINEPVELSIELTTLGAGGKRPSRYRELLSLPLGSLTVPRGIHPTIGA